MRIIDAAHGKLQFEQTISSAKGSTHLLPGLITGFKARSGAPLITFQCFNDGGDSRDSGSDQCVGLFKPVGKIEHGLQIIWINEILLAM